MNLRDVNQQLAPSRKRRRTVLALVRLDAGVNGPLVAGPIRGVGKPALTRRMPTAERFLPGVHPDVQIQGLFGAELLRTVQTLPGEVGAVDVPMVALHEGGVAEHELTVGFRAGNGFEGGVDLAVVLQDGQFVEGFAARFAHVDGRCQAVGAFLVVAESVELVELGITERAGVLGALLFVRLVLLEFWFAFEGSLTGLADERRVVGLWFLSSCEFVFAPFAVVALVDVVHKFSFGGEALPATHKATAERVRFVR